jgi:glycosyltransferase involved in cell wall biosynthesis
VNLILPINSLGYGVVGKNIAREMYKLNKNCNLYVLGDTREVSDKHEIDMINNGAIINRNFTDLRIWHEHDMGFFISKKKRIGLTFFELDRFSKSEKSHLDSLDDLIVPSKWHKQICEEAGINSPKIHVLPMAADYNTFPAISTSYRKFLGYNQLGFMEFEEPDQSNPTVFMTCGKWEIRKGHDIIIECFEKAFCEKDNVKLVVNCLNPFIGEQKNIEWITRYKANLPNQVEIITERLKSQHDLSRIFQFVDCGLFPARSEGFNLEAAELLSMGKRCIMSNYSGHSEYAQAAGAITFDCPNKEIAEDGVFFNSLHPKWEGNPGMWASIGEKEKDFIVDNMRKVHKDKQSGNLHENVHGVLYFRSWTWDKIAKYIYELKNQ